MRHYSKLCNTVNYLFIPFLVGPLSAIHLFSHPRLLGYFRKLAFGSPLGICFTSGLCAANIRHPGISNFHRPVLPGYHFTSWSSGGIFLCSEKLTLGQGRIRTTDLSIQSAVEHATTGTTRNIYI